MVVFSLTLVRHGETGANKDGIIQGHQDVTLSDTGLTQARLVGFRLRNDNFTHIFTSDLSRASETARIIAEANTVCRCSAVHLDSRLRERKFGVYEGKTFKELFTAAEKSNKKWADFTPEGAETYEEVRFRARAFFRDLCEKIAAQRPYIPISVKNTQSTNIDLKNSKTITLHEDTTGKHLFPEEKKNDGSAGKQDLSWQVNSNCSPSVQQVVISKRPRTEEPQLHQLSLTGGVPSSDLDTDCGLDGLQGAGGTTMARSNSSSSSGCSSLHDSVECPEADVDLPTPTEEERDTDSSDVGISRAKQDPSSSTQPTGNDGRLMGNPPEKVAGHSANNWLLDGLQPWVRDTDPSVISGPAADSSVQSCPNVSLSPLLEHRLTSMSTVSSGRNSSFDDADIVPSVAGEVLVVSHGGLIKELITYFIEDLNCKVPGGKGHALRVCPNTGVSRFMVTLSEADLKPTVTCLLINDKEHLSSWREPLPVHHQGI